MVCSRSQYRGLCFFNDLGGGTECTFKEFRNNPKLGGLAASPAWCAVRLETMDESNPLKLRRGKSKVLPLGRNKAVDQFMLEAD